MGLSVNKETVSGLRVMLKHRSIVMALSIAIVLATVFGGLYFLKDSKIFDSFKRDDERLLSIQKAVEQNVLQTEQLRKDVSSIQKDSESLRESMVNIQKNVATAIIFNPNVPANIRAEAFELAKSLKMNHGIRQQYRDFVRQYPDAVWEYEVSASNIQKVIPQGRMVTNENGISYEKYE